MAALSMFPSSLLILVNALGLIRPRATPAPVMMTDGDSMEILYLLVPHEDKDESRPASADPPPKKRAKSRRGPAGTGGAPVEVSGALE